MTIFGRAKVSVQPAAHAEDPVERQYRYLLRTAPTDALEEAHVEALEAVTEQVRDAVLRTVQDALVAGQRLTTGDRRAIARLVTAGERRAPGVFLAACPAGPRRRLADAVVASEAVFGLFTGYAAWDGADPEPADLGVDHGGAHPVDRGDPAAEAKAFAYGHAAAVSTWGTSGG
ncbi:hypothetical protein ASD62_12900 [Phycicoccus sp. Root563]|uniref:hypothetical protein n=1 Tax=Phycicoccus sp. Root563 TaxID=1736562 RepID=UPI000702F6F5|nr:hypothetical protein [Phycicoccus sp. Root563]KQZ90062.1 hypothetical protein ASD62_12900 [Phycicoccus sp. Root563]